VKPRSTLVMLVSAGGSPCNGSKSAFRVGSACSPTLPKKERRHQDAPGFLLRNRTDDPRPRHEDWHVLPAARRLRFLPLAVVVVVVGAPNREQRLERRRILFEEREAAIEGPDPGEVGVPFVVLQRRGPVHARPELREAIA
jgi:hypothetical protein